MLYRTVSLEKRIIKDNTFLSTRVKPRREFSIYLYRERSVSRSFNMLSIKPEAWSISKYVNLKRSIILN